MKRLKLKASMIGLAVMSVVLVTPVSAQAGSKCSGTSESWTCYSTTTKPAKAKKVIRTWVLINGTDRTVKARCIIKTSASYTSTSSHSIEAGAKVELFKVAEASVKGTQTWTDTLTVSESTSLALWFKIAPGKSKTCQLVHGYYKVGTKYEQGGRDGVRTRIKGTTTVPYAWGIRVS